MRTVATRYKGRIHTYEVWNEPNLKMFYSGTREQLVQLAKDAYEVLHEVDPTVVVVSPSVTGGYDVPYFSKLLDLGMGRYADVIGYHFYSSPKTPEAAVDVIQSEGNSNIIIGEDTSSAITTGGSNILIENCEFSYFINDLTFQGYDGPILR